MQTVQHKPEQAFTLVEMLVVIGIIMLVAAISLPLLVPMILGDKHKQAVDHVKLTCLLARSKAVQQRRMFCVTLLEAERCTVVTDYALLRDYKGADPQKPFCPHYLGNYGNPDDRYNTLVKVAESIGEKPRPLPEGCRFDLNDDGSPPSTLESQGWTWIFLPTGAVYTLPPNAENDRTDWHATTYLKGSRPGGPRIFGPRDSRSNIIVVYAMTGRAMSE